MKSEGAVRARFFGWLPEPSVDFYALLNEQAEKTLAGVKALHAWVSEKEPAPRCQTVRDLENEADVLKFQLGKRLFESFITPFDREDIYDLSQQLDEVINRAKSVVREIEAFETSPVQHPHIQELAAVLVEGTENLAASFAALRHQLPEASHQAMLARKSENRLTKIYRQGMRELFELDDIKTILRVKEVYKALLDCAGSIDRVAERLLHAIVKMS